MGLSSSIALMNRGMDAIDKVEAMDFDVLVPGHGKLGDKADVTAFGVSFGF